ncbi:hypothetical protein EK21DRAFT_118652 [Setomelanomma holmii]|uniref:Uncharacterized protein n=1 Tax=Setomelanomma holmii TaxID=210430 RepID=A0A9P4LGG8_9PLEO|nr:hypothetical protein EK21DRAFT_118652 [Setomelanomma holmii]
MQDIYANVAGVMPWKLAIPISLIAFFSQLLALTLFDSKEVSSSKDEIQKTPTIGLLPRTPYSMSDIDQAVPLSIGTVTLFLCICDIVQNCRFQVDDKFRYWKARCIPHVESGNMNIDVSTFRDELEAIDRQARCARTIARHRERELATLRAMPEELKEVIVDWAMEQKDYLKLWSKRNAAHVFIYDYEINRNLSAFGGFV